MPKLEYSDMIRLEYIPRLRCLFKLRVSKPEYWVDFRKARRDTLNVESYQVHRLAYVQAYSPICVDDGGEMIAGPEITRVKLNTGQKDRGFKLTIMDLKSFL